MSILERFPSGFDPRPMQRELLERIDAEIRTGYKKVVLCAPTGIGKSLVGVTLARRFGTSFIVTNSRHLQDQYARDVPYLRPVKGKRNFACLSIMEQRGLGAGGDRAAAMREGLTCDKGECETRTTKDGKAVSKPCKFKPSIREFAERQGGGDGPVCPYYEQKYAGLAASHSIWNYASYFQIIKYNWSNYGHYLNREVAVLDEAHKLEDQIVGFVGVDLYARQVGECGLDPSDYDMSDLGDIESVLEAMAGHYAEELRDIEGSGGGAEGRHALVESRYEAAVKARSDIGDARDNFVVNRPQLDGDGAFRSVSVKPLDISKYVGSFLRTPYQVFMSATIDRDSFCESAGLDRSEVAYVDAPRSPFPPESRRVEFCDTRRLSFRSPPQDELAVIRRADEIIAANAGRRGLVLTSSRKRCYDMLSSLSAASARRVRVCHASNPGGRTQEEIMAEHAASPDGVLLSSSLWEGVDLRGDLSRFQVIAKVPYPNYSENWVRRKKDAFPRWYTSHTIMKMLQGMGRSVRSEDDWAATYVLDANVRSVLSRNRDMVPAAYRDVLGVRPGAGGPGAPCRAGSQNTGSVLPAPGLSAGGPFGTGRRTLCGTARTFGPESRPGSGAPSEAPWPHRSRSARQAAPPPSRSPADGCRPTQV